MTGPATEPTSRPTAVLLVNSRARQAADGEWRSRVERIVGARYDVEVLYPRSAGDGTELARRAASGGAALVVAAGGDGTVNSVAAGLAGSGIAMGILPLGTANDLARELGIPRAIDAAAQRLVDGAPRSVDLGEVNGRVFCTVGGIALTAQTALMVSRLKSASPIARRAADLFGREIYRVASALNLLGRRRVWQQTDVVYTAPDGSEHHAAGPSHTIFVANHHTLGGGLVLPTGSRDDDGVLEIATVPRRSRPSLLLNFARLAAGRPLPAGVLETVRAVRATIRTERDDEFVADGDSLATGRLFTVAVRPRALRVVA